MAVESEEVELMCPDCGDTSIKEWSKVEAAQDVLRVVRVGNGELDVTDWGDTEIMYEYSEHLGYACSNFCKGDVFPLEHFVVENA